MRAAAKRFEETSGPGPRRPPPPPRGSELRGIDAERRRAWPHFSDNRFAPNIAPLLSLLSWSSAST